MNAHLGFVHPIPSIASLQDGYVLSVVLQIHSTVAVDKCSLLWVQRILVYSSFVPTYILKCSLNEAKAGKLACGYVNRDLILTVFRYSAFICVCELCLW